MTVELVAVAIVLVLASIPLLLSLGSMAGLAWLALRRIQRGLLV